MRAGLQAGCNSIEKPRGDIITRHSEAEPVLEFVNDSVSFQCCAGDGQVALLGL